MRTHNSNDQSVACQQPILLAQGSRRKDQIEANGQHLDTDLGNFVYSVLEMRQLLNLSRAFSQAQGDPLGQSTQLSHGLDRHHPVGKIREHVRRSKALDLSPSDAFHELLASRALMGVCRSVVNKRIGVEKDLTAVGDACKGHGDSRMPNSSSSAICRSISTSPAHGIKP